MTKVRENACEKGSQSESDQQESVGKTILAGAFADAVAAYVIVVKMSFASGLFPARVCRMLTLS